MGVEKNGQNFISVLMKSKRGCTDFHETRLSRSSFKKNYAEFIPKVSNFLQLTLSHIPEDVDLRTNITAVRESTLAESNWPPT